MKYFYGVGFNDKTRPSKIAGLNKPTYEYSIWKKMLGRCYDEKFHEKQKTYSSCSVSENFKSYSYFYDWCQNQIGFGIEDWQLDKDIVKKGNKTYSEDFCVFVPREINTILNNSKGARGEFPIGVHFDSFTGRLKSVIRINGRSVNLGRFDDPILAFKAYKIAKEQHIKKVANKWRGLIDNRVYEALMNYTIDIAD